MNFGRILLSASLIAFVGAAAFGGTGAFFSDTETSTGNTFTAGAIDLLIDNTSYGFDWNDPENDNPQGIWGPNPNNTWDMDDLTDQLFFSFGDLKPGDYGEDTISIHVHDNDAWACMALNLTGTPENGLTEPEEDVDETAGDDEGELQDHLSFLFWYDDGDNVLEEDEQVIDELSGLPGSIFTGGWLAIADSATSTPLEGDTTHYIGKGWCFGEMTATPAEQAENANGPTPGNTGFTCDGSGNHNEAQTDGIVVDVAFHAEQSRNNGEFLCANLPPLEEEREDIQAQGPFDGWNSPGDLVFQAEARFGNNGPTGDWEVGVGNNTQDSNQSENTNNIWESGVAVPFSVVYDGNDATFTVNGNAAVDTVGPIEADDVLNIIAGKVSAGVGDSVELTNLELNGSSLAPSSLVDTDNTDASYLVISSEDLSVGFTLTGMVEFNWTNGQTAGSRPAFQVQVRD